MSLDFRERKLLDYEEWYSKNHFRIMDKFFTFLKFKTVSAEVKSKDELHRCCQFLQEFLDDMGFKTEVWEGNHHPILFAAYFVSHSCPTILFYNHYDVQPVNPLHLWNTPPFEPTQKDHKVYARGASDNKGQCFYTLNGIKAFLGATKSPQVNIKVLIEGEEEVGSTGLYSILDKKRGDLKADHVVLVDADIPSLEEPAITLGCRGITTLTLKCIGSNTDLHSGLFGGVAYNPLKAFSQMLAKCWDDRGRVTIEHFYDDIATYDDKALFAFNYKTLLKEFDIESVHREEGFTTLQSNWTRPALEINGISGGYSGEGFKTVLPAEAILKLSARLVPNQDPDKVLESIIEFFQKNLPKGLRIEIEKGHGGKAFRTKEDALIVQLAKAAYEDVLKKPCGLMLSGGSLPIASEFAKDAEMETIAIGMALPTDAIHAPNEHFSLKQFEKGLLMIATLLDKVAASSQEKL